MSISKPLKIANCAKNFIVENIDEEAKLDVLDDDFTVQFVGMIEDLKSLIYGTCFITQDNSFTIILCTNKCKRCLALYNLINDFNNKSLLLKCFLDNEDDLLTFSYDTEYITEEHCFTILDMILGFELIDHETADIIKKMERYYIDED